MVYRLNETTWLQDAGGGAEILNILNWAMLTIEFNKFSDNKSKFGTESNLFAELNHFHLGAVIRLGFGRGHKSKPE